MAAPICISRQCTILLVYEFFTYLYPASQNKQFLTAKPKHRLGLCLGFFFTQKQVFWALVLPNLNRSG